MNAQNKYYVYILMDSTKSGKYFYNDLNMCFLYEPFYVGKGTGNRINRHTHKDSILKETNKLKRNKILKILKSNNKVFKVKLFENITEEESLRIEEKLISEIGRRDLKKGILSNMSNGGEKGNAQNQNKRKKKIIKYDLEGNFLKKYNSIIEAANELNISKGNISLCCNKKILTYKGYIWRFEKDNNIKYDKGLSKNFKKIFQIIDQKIIIYNSVKEFCKEHSLIVSNIVDVLKGRRKNKYNIYYYKSSEVIKI